MPRAGRVPAGGAPRAGSGGDDRPASIRGGSRARHLDSRGCWTCPSSYASGGRRVASRG